MGDVVVRRVRGGEGEGEEREERVRSKPVRVEWRQKEVGVPMWALRCGSSSFFRGVGGVGWDMVVGQGCCGCRVMVVVRWCGVEGGLLDPIVLGRFVSVKF